ncbi:MAG: NAD-dependent epimerase/dehydratase family protein [Geminicoccaceae bacterium]
MNVLITGAAGYIGAMLVEQLLYSNGIKRLHCIDMKECPARFKDHAKVRWIRADVAGDRWAPELQNERIDVVIHCAYQIRELYGRGGDQQRRWNIEGARKLFEFALGRPSVRRLVQLSSITAYGALPTNSLDRAFTEEMPLAEDTYLYGVQKRQVEDLLWQSYRQLRPSTHVVVLRLASVSGPRGRFGLNRYGLLSTVAGSLPSLVCGRSDWGRQYLHEDDLVGVLSMYVHLPPTTAYQVFNVSPADFLDSAALGRLFDKRVVVLPPALMRTLFCLTWHGSRGAVTTPSGAWKFLTYPIRVDGRRLTQAYGYEYRYSSLQALIAQEGRYADRSCREVGGNWTA